MKGDSFHQHPVNREHHLCLQRGLMGDKGSFRVSEFHMEKVLSPQITPLKKVFLKPLLDSQNHSLKISIGTFILTIDKSRPYRNKKKQNKTVLLHLGPTNSTIFFTCGC